MPYRAVIFDMDGVLVDSERFYAGRRLRFLHERGMIPGPGFDGTGSNDRAIWRELVPDNDELRERLKSEYMAYAREHPAPWRELVNPEAQDTLAALRGAGMRLAICSSSRHLFVEDFVRSVGLDPLLDALVTADDCADLKPDPAPYALAMRRLGVTPDEAVVVEDSPIGIRAGRAAGALVCALRPPDGTGLDQGEADVVLGELREVLALLAAYPTK